MRELLEVTQALADESRLRILAALAGGELCVCQILEILDLAPSTVSKHLAILRQARLIDGRKDGRWMHYRLADEDVPAEARSATTWILAHLLDEKRVTDDRAHLKKLLKLEPEEVTRRQRAGERCCG